MLCWKTCKSPYPVGCLLHCLDTLITTRLLADPEKEKHVIKKEMNFAAAISDLENWSEYKVRRLVEETSMN